MHRPWWTTAAFTKTRARQANPVPRQEGRERARPRASTAPRGIVRHRDHARGAIPRSDALAEPTPPHEAVRASATAQGHAAAAPWGTARPRPTPATPRRRRGRRPARRPGPPPRARPRPRSEGCGRDLADRRRCRRHLHRPPDPRCTLRRRARMEAPDDARRSLGRSHVRPARGGGALWLRARGGRPAAARRRHRHQRRAGAPARPRRAAGHGGLQGGAGDQPPRPPRQPRARTRSRPDADPARPAPRRGGTGARRRTAGRPLDGPPSRRGATPRPQLATAHRAT